MFKVYWSDKNNLAYSQDYADLSAALNVTKNLRDSGFYFVTMVSENPNHVGKAGVDSIKDGKTPDGVDYDWSKQDRAGKMRKRDTLVTIDDH